MSVSPSLNPHVSVDCVIFGFSKETLRLLLIKRTVPNSLTELDDSYYALPGDLVRDNENLDEAAARVLKELTGLSGIFLQQFQAFGDPMRITKAKDRAWLQGVRQDPGARVITVAYMALIDSNKVQIEPGSFSKEAVWLPISEVPELGFDHNDISEGALMALRSAAPRTLALAERTSGRERRRPVRVSTWPRLRAVSMVSSMYRRMPG